MGKSTIMYSCNESPWQCCISTGQLYKTLAEKKKKKKKKSAVSIPIDFKWEHRILQTEVDTDFVNSALFIFTRAKHVVLNVQGQRMWNAAFVTISPTQWYALTFHVPSIITINNRVPMVMSSQKTVLNQSNQLYPGRVSSSDHNMTRYGCYIFNLTIRLVFGTASTLKLRVHVVPDDLCL